MCLINLQFQQHPKYKLIVAANRDEEYNRPTKEAHFWEDEPTILAGRDLLGQGTWLGITKNGRFAALTNYRDPKLPAAPFSRGDIVKEFLSENAEPEAFIKKLSKTRDQYGGYNVVVGDANRLLHYNNILDETNLIHPGTHSLSNHSLNTPWPKVVKAKERLNDYLTANQDEVDIEVLFNILADQERATDEELPDTGVGLEMERNLSPLFIKIPNYGTRASTVLLIDRKNRVTFIERTFKNGAFQFDSRFQFQLDEG